MKSRPKCPVQMVPVTDESSDSSWSMGKILSGVFVFGMFSNLMGYGKPIWNGNTQHGTNWGNVLGVLGFTGAIGFLGTKAWSWFQGKSNPDPPFSTKRKKRKPMSIDSKNRFAKLLTHQLIQMMNGRLQRSPFCVL